jgi:ubiquinol-cytochrome c reductase cytochrome c1 subunit
MFTRIVRTFSQAAAPRQAVARALATSSARTSKASATKNGTLELLAGASLLSMGGLWFANTAHAESPDHIHPMDMPWDHGGIFSGYDSASIRRGYIVYKNVCAACHSLERIHYRELVGVCMSEDEAKAASAEIDVVDGPNDIGAMFERPGKLSDPLPSPYANGTFHITAVKKGGGEEKKTKSKTFTTHKNMLCSHI